MSNTNIVFPANASVGDTYTYGTAIYKLTSTGWILNIAQSALPQFISGVNILDNSITNASISSTAAIHPSKILASAFTAITCTDLTGTGLLSFLNATVSNTLTASNTLAANVVTLNTLTVNTSAIITAPIINSGATINGGATINNTAVINNGATINGGLTLNGTSTVNNAITFNGVVTVQSQIENTGASHFKLPVGTTGQRPVTLAAGQIRYNSTLSYPEWYSPTTSVWLPFSFNSANVDSTIGALFVAGRSAATTYTKQQINMNSNGILSREEDTLLGVAKYGMMGVSFGTGQNIIGWGATTTNYNYSYIYTNLGVVGVTSTQVGTARRNGAGVPFGGDQGIIGYGYTSTYTGIILNKISNVGVVASDISAPTGSGRYNLCGLGYGNGLGMFAFGLQLNPTSTINMVAYDGTVASQTTAAGVPRSQASGSSYGGDKGIIAYGSGSDSNLSIGGGDVYFIIESLISNTGTFATDRYFPDLQKKNAAAASYSGDKNATYGGTTNASTAVYTNTLVLRSNTAVVTESRNTGGSVVAGNTAFTSNFAASS
ncbi:hypothetical protein UFOVP1192_6 [uncultured Caudovirales phage]|uniref:Uncharacterized protein n=1 Tax=uncultured Caudovirales phage TaxID=2100421 RepID=A0A6J5R0N2_9CAUD|nr:hypothetical protein UFOVP1192_6 [uncultured Caudovirales phage]